MRWWHVWHVVAHRGLVERAQQPRAPIVANLSAALGSARIGSRGDGLDDGLHDALNVKTGAARSRNDCERL